MRPKILLINPWIYDFAAINMWARPLGLLRVAEFLSAYDLELKLIDCMDTPTDQRFHVGKFPKTILPPPACLRDFKRTYARYGISLTEFQQQLKAALPVDAIVVTSIMTYWYPGVFESIRQCKAISPNTPICLGGIYTQLYPEHAFSHSGADAIYMGRVDKTFLQVLQNFGLNLKKIRTPQPYYRLNLYPDMTYAPLLTSVGCQYSCVYCAASILHPKFEQRQPAKVLQEIQDLQTMGVQDFAFYDDALLFQPEKHIHKILHAVIQSGIKANFHTPNGLHARFLDLKTAELMKAAGFKTIRLSLETINPQRQVATGGKIANDEFEAAIRNLQKAGFTKKDIGVYLMYGLPEQPIEEIWEGIHFLEKLDVRIHLTEFSPLPGTKIWQELLNKKIISPELDPLLTNNTVFSILFSGYPQSEVKKFKDYVAKTNQTPGRSA